MRWYGSPPKWVMSDKSEDPSLLALAAALADGTAIDWEKIEGQDLPPNERLLVEDLRRVASVVRAHRSAVTPPAFVPRHWRHLLLLECVGTGAFGSVYKGWDSQVDREVAVKLLLPARDAAPPLDEPRALARIRHPNVVVVYGADQDEEGVGIWMEYIEGQTLADIVRDRGPMSAREVSGIGVDLCRALSALHAAGLVHRDIKAQNVMREVGGRIVLMDFSGAEGMAQEAKPTFSGTPAYMAPELFEGAAASAKSDVYSLGVLLFFLISGRFPVDGRGVSELRNAHARRERTRLRDVRPDAGDGIVQVIERATAYDPEVRYQTAGELEGALIAASGAHAVIVSAGNGGAAATSKGRGTRIGWVPQLLIGGLLLATIGLAADRWRAWRAPSPAAAPLARFTVGEPYLSGSWPRLSPDGRFIVFGGIFEGQNRLWIRPIDATTSLPLKNTTATETPFWSPDSRFLGFFEEGKLRKVSLAGEVSDIVSEAPHPRGGDWNESGTILFAREGGIYRVSADGQNLAPVTQLDRSLGDYEHGWPEFLPDGRRFVYVIRSLQPDRAGVYVGSLDSPNARRLMRPHSRAAYANGHLLFVQDGTLLAQPFDLQTETVHGEPVKLAADVQYHRSSDAAFDVASGVLIHGSTPEPALRRVKILDRDGGEIEILDALGAARQPQLSPDGQRIAFEHQPDDGRGSDVWVYDTGRSSSSALTRSASEDMRPVWSPDGSRVAFSSKRGLLNIYAKTVNGTDHETPLVTDPGDALVESWSPDGAYLSATIRRSGLWILPLEPGMKPWPVRTDLATEVWQSEFSPDGRWLAYASAESGSLHVYVEPFPATGDRWQVSTAGGAEPHWAKDPLELFYLSADGQIMSVPVGPGGWQGVKPTALFPASVQEVAGAVDYDVSPDGTRFIVNTVMWPPVSRPLSVVVNWRELLSR